MGRSRRHSLTIEEPTLIMVSAITPFAGSNWGPKLGHFAGLSGVSLL